MTASTSKILRTVGRRLLLPVEGDSVRESLEALRGNHARLEVTGQGRIDAVRIDGVRQDGVHLIVSLSGSVTVDTFVVTVVARAADGTLRAGLLDDARSIDATLSVELLEVEEPQAQLKSAPAKPTWAEVAKASAAQVPEPEEGFVPLPKLGDLIVHPTFGECNIAKVESDDDFIIARTPTNRMLRLSLDVLRLEHVSTDDNGRTTFRARGGVKK